MSGKATEGVARATVPQAGQGASVIIDVTGGSHAASVLQTTN